MKKLLLFAFALTASSLAVTAQNYNPAAADGLPGGELGTAYTTDIAVSVPSSTPIGLDQVPGLPSTAGIPGLPDLVSMTITTTTLTVEGLPAGLNGSCIPLCTYLGGASGTITISGTPSEFGAFDVNITSSTTGIADLSTLILALELANTGGLLDGIISQIPQSVPVPDAPGILDEGPYALFIADPNGINDLSQDSFDATLSGQNPFRNSTSFGVNMTKPGDVIFTFTDLSGRVADKMTVSLEKGLNRILYNSELSGGNYIFNVQFEGEVVTGKISVLK